jgi:cellulose synthase/poly-beta-1,6-N-acetylglucosamine synthase-like glycosyltransferase
MRQAGYRVVLAPDAWVYHPLPESLRKFIRTFIRNGYGSAYIQVFHPDINYDTDETLYSRNFTPKRSFLFRIIRYPVRLIKSLCTFQWIRFIGYSVYVIGYLIGYVQFSLERSKKH